MFQARTGLTELSFASYLESSRLVSILNWSENPANSG